MHPTALNFGKSFFDLYCNDLTDATVVDIGSQNVNGSLKDVCPPSLKYIGVDFVVGNGVDIVLEDPYKLPFGDTSVDVVVCSSCFEHSDFFWLLFLEVLRVLKPEGLFYLNVPSNGYFHKYPVDSWRFYPDSGKSLVAWAGRNGFTPVLLESFIGAQGEGPEGKWNDFVAVFGKTAAAASSRATFMVDVATGYFNGYRYGDNATLLERFNTQDMEILEEREARIVALNQAVLAGKNEIIRRDELIAGLSQTIAERDGQVVGLRQTIAAMEEQISGLYTTVRERDELLTQLLSSRSWKMTAPLRVAGHQARRGRRILRLLPGVMQRKGGVFTSAVKFFSAFHREGFAGVKRRLRNQLARQEAMLTNNALAEMSLVEASGFESSLQKLQVAPHYLNPFANKDLNSLLTKPAIAIHLHLFHEELINIHIDHLLNVPVRFDLYVSVKEICDTDELKKILLEKLQNIENIVIEKVPNRGRDIAPLIIQFGKRLMKYDIIAHVHTKKSDHNNKLGGWFAEIADLLFGSKSEVIQILELLGDDAKIVYPERNLNIVLDRTGWSDNYELSKDILKKYTELDICDFPFVEFPQGSMFWAKTKCLNEFLSLPISYADFPEEPLPADGTLAHALERLILVFASKYDGKCYRIHKKDSVGDYKYYEEQQDYSQSITHSSIKVLSYYLPQFHPIPENDEWHGKGFTEWTKVRTANPLFAGHYQQHIPHKDIGYYLLDSPDILLKQSDMMRKSGVHGQIFYHYWFSGKLILDEPAKMLLENKHIEMPFCFCWANENWTRRWDGNEDEVLLKQNYSCQDATDFIKYLIPFFKDSRYINIDMRPALFIYRPSAIPDFKLYLEIWEKECLKNDLKAPYIVAVLTRGALSPQEFGMDAGTERVLHDWTNGNVADIKNNLYQYRAVNGSVLSYDEVANFYTNQTENKDFTYFRSIVPIWDNTARYGSEAFLLHGSTTEKFQKWMEYLVEYTESTLPVDKQIIIVNAWNEWAEGAHLEPDTRFGYGYLNSIGRTLSSIKFNDLDAIFTNINGNILNSVVIKIEFSSDVLDSLRNNSQVRNKFISCLSRSTIFGICRVIIDEQNIIDYLKEWKDDIAIDDLSMESDYNLLVGAVSCFSNDMIELLVKMGINHKTSVICGNNYSKSSPIRISENASIDSCDAYAIRLYPSRVNDYKNYKVCYNAVCVTISQDTINNSISNEKNLPEVTTIIRFHKNADITLLNTALLSLMSQIDCVVRPIIAAQDLSVEQISLINKYVNQYAWNNKIKPVISLYNSDEKNTDLRSRMLNLSFKSVKTRYVAFLDYDDFLYPSAYQWLLSRLTLTGKNVSFGNIFTAIFDRSKLHVTERKKYYEYGSTYEKFVDLNHAPLHSFMIDIDGIDLENIVYFDDMKYMEDYYLTLQVFTKDNADWESLKFKHYIGDYMHSVDAEHTLAFANDAEREAILRDKIYVRCEERICKLREKIKKSRH